MSNNYMDQTQKPWFSNRSYNALKWVAQILLPATGALYFGLSQIWGLPNGEQVVGTITIGDVFLGALLGLSSRAYNNSDEKYDGTLVVDLTEDKDVYTFDVGENLQELRNKEQIVLNVVRTAKYAE